MSSYIPGSDSASWDDVELLYSGMTKLAVALVAGIFGIAAGFFAGRSTAPNSNNFESAAGTARVLRIDDQESPGTPNAAPLILTGRSQDHEVAPKRGTDLITAIWSALDNPNETERELAFAQLIENMHPNDAPAVRGVFLEGDKQGRWFVPEWGRFWRKWGEIDGAAGAALLIEEDEDDAGSRSAAGLIMGTWVAQDPESVKSWVDANDFDDSEFGARLVTSFMRAYASADSDGAAEYATSLEEGWQRNQAISAAVSGIAQTKGIGGVEKWLRTIPGELTPDLATSALMPVFGKMGKENSHEWLEGYAADPARNDVIIEAFASSGWRNSSSESLDFFAGLPPSPHDGEQTGLLKTAQRLARYEPEALDSWLVENPTNIAADNILADFAESTASRGDLETGVARASRIRDPELQARVLKELESYVEN